MTLCLYSHILLCEIILFLLQCQVVAPRIEGFNIDIVEPNEVLQIMHQAYFGGNGLSLGEMVHYLIPHQSIMVDVLASQSPFEVEADRVGVFILHPASLLKDLFEPAIASSDDKYFLIFGNVILLFPCLHISDVLEHLHLHLIPLEECLQVWLNKYFLLGLSRIALLVHLIIRGLLV
jgi:hypothetical protein